MLDFFLIWLLLTLQRMLPDGVLFRILSGDLIWFALGGIGALLGWSVAGVIKNSWLRFFVGILLAAVGIYGAHYLYEVFITWYKAPLGEPLHLTTYYLPLVARQ